MKFAILSIVLISLFHGGFSLNTFLDFVKTKTNKGMACYMPLSFWGGQIVNVRYLSREYSGSTCAKTRSLHNGKIDSGDYCVMGCAHVKEENVHQIFEVFCWTHECTITTDQLPEKLFEGLPNLKVFSFYNQHSLKGTIPDDLLSSAPNLEKMLIAISGLSGTIPKNVMEHNAKIKSFELTSAALINGDFPKFAPTLETFTISACPKMTPTFSDDYFGECKELKQISIGSNGLTGSLPSSLDNCKQLTLLNLPNNKLSGKIILRNMAKLNYILLSNNEFSGTPDFSGSLNVVKTLDLQNNYLSGDMTSMGITQTMTGSQKCLPCRDVPSPACNKVYPDYKEPLCVSTFQDEIAKLKSVISADAVTIAQQKLEIANKNALIETKEQHIHSITESHSSKEEQVRLANAEAQAKDAQISSQAADIALKNKRIDDLSATIKEQEDSIRNKESMITSKTSIIASITAELKVKEEEKAALQATVEKLEKKDCSECPFNKIVQGTTCTMDGEGVLNVLHSHHRCAKIEGSTKCHCTSIPSGTKNP